MTSLCCALILGGRDFYEGSVNRRHRDVYPYVDWTEFALDPLRRALHCLRVRDIGCNSDSANTLPADLRRGGFQALGAARDQSYRETLLGKCPDCRPPYARACSGYDNDPLF